MNQMPILKSPHHVGSQPIERVTFNSIDATYFLPLKSCRLGREGKSDTIDYGPTGRFYHARNLCVFHQSYQTTSHYHQTDAMESYSDRNSIQCISHNQLYYKPHLVIYLNFLHFTNKCGLLSVTSESMCTNY